MHPARRTFRRPPAAPAGAWLLGAGVAVAGWALVRARCRWSFAERGVVVAGGSRGLGLLLARRLARERARVALLARDPVELERARRELEGLGGEVLAFACDVTDRPAVESAVAAAAARFGRLDALLNVAGVIQVGPLENLPAEDFEASLRVHVLGPLYTTLAALPYLRCAAGGGRIANVASIGGLFAVPHLLPYCTGKFGLVGLSEGLRVELAASGVHVTTVCPGLMRTGSHVHALFRGRQASEARWFSAAATLPGLSMDADRAARAILAAVRRGRSRLVLSPPAKLAALAHGVAPAAVAAANALVNRLLPAPAAGGTTAALRGDEARLAAGRTESGNGAGRT